MARPKAIRHEGLHAYRLKFDNPREKAFSRRWKKENYEGKILQWLLVRTTDGVLAGSHKFEQLAPYDQQSASVAATVVQWLGSNVGMDFLRISLANCGYELKLKGVANGR